MKNAKKNTAVATAKTNRGPSVPLTQTSFEIQDIPVESTGRTRSGGYPYAALAIGQSFTVFHQDGVDLVKRLSSSVAGRNKAERKLAYAEGRDLNEARRFKLQLLADGHVRVGRIQ